MFEIWKRAVLVCGIWKTKYVKCKNPCELNTPTREHIGLQREDEAVENGDSPAVTLLRHLRSGVWLIFKEITYSRQLPNPDLLLTFRICPGPNRTCFQTQTKMSFFWLTFLITHHGPSLWSSGLGPGYRSKGMGSIFWVVGLERGPLSLVSTTEELLERKIGAPV
jgi:hypothetical protein